MERVKRRWWTWAVSLIAATVLLGAVLSGAFQLAVLAVPSYREDLAAWVSDVAGRPVQIGGISLAWRGLAPRFDLTGITLFSADGAEQLSVERLSLGIGLRRLAFGEWVPNRLELAGLRVTAEVGTDGRIRIAGFEPGDTALPSRRREQWLNDLERFERVVLQTCELRVLHPSFDGLPLALRLDSVDLSRTDQGFELVADLRLPAERGGRLRVGAEIEGHVAQLRSWRGRFQANADRLQPQGWLLPWLLPGTQVAAAGLGGRVSGEIGDGRLTRARVELDSDALVLARAGVLSSANSARAVFDYFRDPRGWRLDVADLSLDGEPLLRGSLRHDRLDGELAYDLDADRLELTRLAPWAAVWRGSPEWLYAAGRASGLLEGVVLRYRAGTEAAPRYSLRARLAGVALRADRHFGFAGLDGELSADELGGRLQIAPTPLVLELPATLEQPVALDNAAAELRWQRLADGWRLSSEAFEWRLASIEGRGRFALLLPQDADASPHLDLSASFSAGDANDGKPFMPLQWPDSLREWLERGIVAARVPAGELRINGPLEDFPFRERPTGQWQLTLDAADAVLDYAPGWPRITDARAKLVFSGNGLAISGDQASISGNRAQSARVRFDDFRDRRMSVEARVDGDLRRYYAFLRASPLREPLKGLLDNTEAAGQARVDLRLDIPFERIEETAVDGLVTLTEAQLAYGALQPPITALEGTLRFSERSVSAERLDGQFGDLPLVLRIDAEEGTRGVVRGSFDYEVQADGRGPSQFVPEFARAALQGSSRWQLELPIRDADTALTLRSDLIGTAVELPAPLGKPADEAAPVSLRIGADDFAPTRVAMSYDRRLSLDLIMAREAQDWRVGGFSARLGGLSAPPAQNGLFRLDGSVERMDLKAWSGLLDSGDGRIALDSADVDAASLSWGALSLRATRLRYWPIDGGWRMDLEGEGAKGRLLWQSGGGGLLNARLEHMSVDLGLPQVEAQVASPERPPIDPNELPAVDFVSEHFSAGDADLGRAEVLATRVTGGLALQRLRIGGGIGEANAAGVWRRVDGQSSADLRFDLDSSDVRKLLVAFGYAPNVQAQRARFDGELRWAPAAAGLRWEMAEGRIDVDLEQGQLRAVQPGPSRVLGLINFYALPRRLTLNFDDVVGQGLAFDRVKGRFALAAGDAVTDDLRIEGPSLRMDIRGRVGLAARDYDQRVKVYPDVSAGVTLGAVLLGGPAVGALVLLAQELLDKPLDQVTQLSYRITGPWDNPRVDRLDGSRPD